MVRTSVRYRTCLNAILEVPGYRGNFTDSVRDLQAQNSIFGFLEIVGFSQHDLDIPLICMSRYNTSKIEVLHTVAKGLKEGKIVYFPLYRKVENPPKLLSPDEIIMEMAAMSNKCFPKLVECVDGEQYIIAHGLIINYRDSNILINISYKTLYNRLLDQIFVSDPVIEVSKSMLGSIVPLHKAIINKFIPYMSSQFHTNLEVIFKDIGLKTGDITLKPTDNLSGIVANRLKYIAEDCKEILKNGLEKVLDFNAV